MKQLFSQEERKIGGVEKPAPGNEAATKEEESNSNAACPPRYEASTCQETPSAPPPYTETGNQEPSALLYIMLCKTLFPSIPYTSGPFVFMEHLGKRNLNILILSTFDLK